MIICVGVDILDACFLGFQLDLILGFYLDSCESGDNNPIFYSPFSLYGQLSRLHDDRDIRAFKLPCLFLLHKA